MPYDAGGNGDCFFKSVSHQLYKTADLHFEIRKAGIQHLNNHPVYFTESISDNNWQSYIQQMSTSGTWCDNIIIQAVSNAFNCVIHITESDTRGGGGTPLCGLNGDVRPDRVWFSGCFVLNGVSISSLSVLNRVSLHDVMA